VARKPTEYVQFKLRIRESLRRKIERAALKGAHSANAEAVKRLEYTFAEEESWEAHHKEMEKHREEIEDQQRQWYEEQAREQAEHKAALQDSQLLRKIVGGDENAQLLRLMVLGLGNNPGWAANPESRKALADKVHHFLPSHEFNEGDSE
jgi:hypothetical protein